MEVKIFRQSIVQPRQTYIGVLAFVLGLKDDFAVVRIKFPRLLDQSRAFSLFCPMNAEGRCTSEFEYSIHSNIHRTTSQFR